MGRKIAQNNETKAKRTNRKLFSKEEDQKLIYFVHLLGMKWSDISSVMNGRTTRQCRERYKTYLAPSVNMQPWTPEEDMKLIELYNKYGPKWADIAKFFNGRTDNNVKNRWHIYIKVKYPELVKFKKDNQIDTTNSSNESIFSLDEEDLLLDLYFDDTESTKYGI